MRTHTQQYADAYIDTHTVILSHMYSTMRTRTYQYDDAYIDTHRHAPRFALVKLCLSSVRAN